MLVKSRDRPPRLKPKKTRRSCPEEEPRSVFNTTVDTSMLSPEWVASELE